MIFVVAREFEAINGTATKWMPFTLVYMEH
jgi:hypothetical protein